MIKQYKVENFESYENRLNYIQSEWKTIREECLQVPIPRFKVYHTMIDVVQDDFGWLAYSLYYKFRLLDFDRYAPKTTKILSSVDVVNAGFSLFLPNTETDIHAGNTPYTYRSHLGLDVPEDCGFEIEGDDLSIKNGEINIFKSDSMHKAWNKSDNNRFILLLDFLRPEYTEDYLISKVKPEVSINITK